MILREKPREILTREPRKEMFRTKETLCGFCKNYKKFDLVAHLILINAKRSGAYLAYLPK